MTLADVYDSDLPPMLRLIMGVIVVQANAHNGICSPSIDQIAAQTALCRREVQYGLRDLERIGCLEIERATGRGQTNRFRPKGCIKGAFYAFQISQQNQQKGASGAPFSPREPYTMSSLTSPCTLSPVAVALETEDESEISAEVRDLSKRAKVIIRRQQVRDGYLSFLAILDDGQFVTAPGLAKELGMSPATVRNDLMALFRSLDIPLEAQFRFRRVKPKPWHRGKMTGKVVNFCDHGRGAK